MRRSGSSVLVFADPGSAWCERKLGTAGRRAADEFFSLEAFVLRVTGLIREFEVAQLAPTRSGLAAVTE